MLSRLLYATPMLFFVTLGVVQLFGLHGLPPDPMGAAIFGIGALVCAFGGWLARMLGTGRAHTE